MFVLTLHLSAAVGFHGSLWGKHGPQGSCHGPEWGRRAVTCTGHAVPRPGLGPKLSTIYFKAFIVCHPFAFLGVPVML